jgi:hypothetical protein
VGFRPPVRPSSFATFNPAWVRSRIIVPLKFGEDAHYLHHHAFCWCRRVNGLGQTFKASSSLVNLFLKTNGKQPHQITTPKQEDQKTDPLRPFFPDQNFVPLTEVLSPVNQHTRFLSSFQHWQQVYTKYAVDEKTLYAAIMGLGCSIGTRK